MDIWRCFKALVIDTFNGDISKWDTGKVTDMDICFLPLLRSTRHWELEHSASD